MNFKAKCLTRECIGQIKIKLDKGLTGLGENTGRQHSTAETHLQTTKSCSTPVLGLIKWLGNNL